MNKSSTSNNFSRKNCGNLYEYFDLKLYSKEHNSKHSIFSCFLDDIEDVQASIKLESSIEKILNKYNSKCKYVLISDIIKHLDNSSTDNDKYSSKLDIRSKLEFVNQCIFYRYSNSNNYREVNRNTNSYDSNNDVYYLKNPVIFINGMNIGGLRNLEKMDYRNELSLFI